MDMLHGSLLNKILLFSLPLAASSILQQLFNSVDVAVVGRFASDQALAAVGSNSSVISLMINLFVGISVGANVVIANYIGQKDERGIKNAIHTVSVIALTSGCLLLVVGLLIARPILEAMDTPDDVIDLAVLYLRIYFLGMPALAVYNCGNAIFSADGDTARPVRYLLLAGVLNVIMNLFFVVICKMDVAGVATASAISQYVSAGLILRDLFCINTDYRLHLSKLRPDPSKTIDILKIGIPSGLQNAIFALANLFVQVGVNSFSATMVAGNSAAANSDGLIYDVMAAIYTACASFMSQNLGAGKRDRVLKSYLISLLYSFGIGGAMGLLLVIFGKQFLSLFTADPEVITAGLKRLTIMGFSYGVSAFMDCTIAASRALGKSLVPMFIVIMGSCVFRVVWVYTVFAYFKTIPSLYLLYVFSWTITAIAEIIYFLHVYRGIFPKANAVA